MTLEDDLPTSRFVAVIAEDTGTSPPVLVMMGGKNAEQNPIREIWEFDGTNWLNKTAESDMPTTSDVPCSMIYDSRRRCFLCSFPDGSIWSYNRHKWELIKEAGKGINGQLAMDDRSGVLYLFSIEDGLFASIPREAILKHLLGKIPLQGAPLKDADINKNGILDVADLITRIIQLNIQQRK